MIRTKKIARFHRDVHMPRRVALDALTALVRKNGAYRLTPHAAERCELKQVRLPDRIPVRDVELVEVTLHDGEVEKMLVRFPHDTKRDACVSVTKDGWVCTAWLNNRQDRHLTLDSSVYATS